jgi:hypothetical protein
LFIRLRRPYYVHPRLSVVKKRFSNSLLRSLQPDAHVGQVGGSKKLFKAQRQKGDDKENKEKDAE